MGRISNFCGMCFGLIVWIVYIMKKDKKDKE